MMGLFNKLRNFFGKKETKLQLEEENKPILENKQKNIITNLPVKLVHNEPEEEEEDDSVVDDLWNYIDPLKNTQAYHVISVIGFEEWVDMQTVKDRIKQLFFIEYKNEKSLYPYIKTLVDIGLLETNSIGGKRQWKKREILISINKDRAVITSKNKSGLKVTK